MTKILRFLRREGHFGSDDMHDALMLAVQVVQGDAEFTAILLQGVYLGLGHRIEQARPQRRAPDNAPPL